MTGEAIISKRTVSAHPSLIAKQIGDAHPSLTDLVLDMLRHQIVRGERPSGERLIEAEIADEFGVSRNPVREAIKLLNAEGFADVFPRRGAVVARISREAAIEVFEVREALEAAAAAAAARNVHLRPPGALTEFLAEQEDAYSTGDAMAASEANTDFHNAIALASGNQRLVKLLVPLRWQIAWIFQQSARERADRSLAEHRLIAEVIDAGREADARRLAAHHIFQARSAFLSHTESSEGSVTSVGS